MASPVHFLAGLGRSLGPSEPRLLALQNGGDVVTMTGSLGRLGGIRPLRLSSRAQHTGVRQVLVSLCEPGRELEREDGERVPS